MESGSELSKTVATFIMQKILLDDAGITYICATTERFYAVSQVLGSMVENPSVRLLKHVVRCYLRLSDNPRAREALRQCLPEALRHSTFLSSYLKDDGSEATTTLKRWHQQLIYNLTNDVGASPSSMHHQHHQQ